MTKSQVLLLVPALMCFASTGCSDDGNRVPERGMAKKYVEDFPDLVEAQRKADEEAERENKNDN